MKKIIDNKIYDTDKAENIFSYRRAYKVRDILSQSGYTYYAWSDVDVYKTKKGNYFIHVKEENEEYIEIYTEEQLKSTIQELDVEKYIELFGTVEDA